jgi:hypothetical protein
MEQTVKYLDHSGQPKEATFTGIADNLDACEFICKLVNWDGIDSYIELLEDGKKTLGISPTENRKKRIS